MVGTAPFVPLPCETIVGNWTRWATAEDDQTTTKTASQAVVGRTIITDKGLAIGIACMPATDEEYPNESPNYQFARAGSRAIGVKRHGGVHPALCAEMVDLLEEETEIAPQEGRTARSWGDSVEETPSTTRGASDGDTWQGGTPGDENMVWRSIRQG